MSPATQFYFAYGSNLSHVQMRSRCPRAIPYGRAYLPDYQIDFKENGSRCGVTTIEPALGKFVEGGLYRITGECRKQLDRFEGYPFTYYREKIRVFTYDHQEIMAITYVMQDHFYRAVPSVGYVRRIEEGYKDFRIPMDTLRSAYNSVKRSVYHREIRGATHARTNRSAEMGDCTSCAAGHIFLPNVKKT
ncbi:gamma-glutamylcyclotransferase family protein [Cohnella soli]|uniref:Gamma-glutamylcyclotransferase family protein n=1 Tax=Cohnella soli TaxID=425005 RepID=A0ABW0HMK9_9BACL